MDRRGNSELFHVVRFLIFPDLMEQQVDNLIVPLLSCGHEYRYAPFVPGVEFGTVPEQQLHDLELSSECGLVQGFFAQTVYCLDIGTAVKEAANELCTAEVCCLMQSCIAQQSRPDRRVRTGNRARELRSPYGLGRRPSSVPFRPMCLLY